MGEAMGRGRLSNVQRALGRLLSATAIFGLLTVVPCAHAQQSDTAGAAAAYQQAQEADVRGDHARAGELYELAHRLVPAPAALRSAARARWSAGQLATAAGHAATMLRAYPNDAKSQELATTILAQAERELARVEVTCEPACVLELDGVVINVQAQPLQSLFARPGEHALVAHFADKRTKSESLSIELGKSTTLLLRAPVSAPQPVIAASPEREQEHSPVRSHKTGRRQLSPLYGLVASGLTAVLAGVTVWSRIDTRDARDAFVKEPTRRAFEEGENKDLRTQLLLGGSVALAAASVTLLVLADWKPRERAAQNVTSGSTRVSRTHWSLQAGRGFAVQLRHTF